MRSAISVVFSLVLAQSMLFAADFTRFSDMCETTATQHCPNKPDEIKALQEALNSDPSLYLYIKADGKWSVGTREAVIAFQEHYGIRPANGYVGKQTRMFLQKIAGAKQALATASASPKPSTSQPRSASKKRTQKPKPVLPPKTAPTREFVLYGDMCDNTIPGNHCPNKLIEVSNLQILLNADPNLNVNIEPDGKWGKGTQQAVIAFQKRYGITPASGYVGARTKRMLDRVAGAMVAKAAMPSTPKHKTASAAPAKKGAKNAISAWQDMCTKSAADSCPNRPEDVRGLQAFLNRALGLKLAVDGKWGQGTARAVIRFQKQHNITPANGYVGRKTRAVMQRVRRKPRTKASGRKHLIRHPIRTYADFRKYTDYPRTYKVYKNPKLLTRATGSNTRVKIDISEQRLRLYVHNQVALDSPCTTGAKRKLEPNTRTIRDKSTPKGTFRITEKIAVKRSTIFGDIYRNGKKVYHGDRRKYRGSWKGAKFVGHPLRNWMRLTSSGIGLHASRYIKRRPGSNGCVRLPYTVANVVFKKVKPGTPVKIVN